MHPEEQEEGADQARVRLLHEVVQVFAILRRHLHACASKRHRLSLRRRLALRLDAPMSSWASSSMFLPASWKTKPTTPHTPPVRPARKCASLPKHARLHRQTSLRAEQPSSSAMSSWSNPIPSTVQSR